MIEIKNFEVMWNCSYSVVYNKYVAVLIWESFPENLMYQSIRHEREDIRIWSCSVPELKLVDSPYYIYLPGNGGGNRFCVTGKVSKLLWDLGLIRETVLQEVDPEDKCAKFDKVSVEKIVSNDGQIKIMVFKRPDQSLHVVFKGLPYSASYQNIYEESPNEFYYDYNGVDIPIEDCRSPNKYDLLCKSQFNKVNRLKEFVKKYEEGSLE